MFRIRPFEVLVDAMHSGQSYRAAIVIFNIIDIPSYAYEFTCEYVQNSWYERPECIAVFHNLNMVYQNVVLLFLLNLVTFIHFFNFI